MYWTKTVWTTLVLLAVGLTGLGAGWWARRPVQGEAVAAEETQRRPEAREGKADDPLQEEMEKRAAARLQLRQLAVAMHAYNAVKGHLSAPAITDARGKPLLSWRVAVLPYLEQSELYKEFRLNEAWDSPHNKKLLAKMPKVFASPGVKTPQPHSTFYQVIGGPGAIFPGADVPVPEGPRLSNITDGTSNTLLIVEADTAVPWTKPEDVAFDPKKPLPRLGGVFPNFFHVAFADGSVRSLPKALDPAALRAAITASGGEPIDWEKAARAPAALSPARREALERLRQRNARLNEEVNILREVLDELKAQVEAARWASEEERALALDPTALALRKENAELEKTLRESREQARKILDEIRKLKDEAAKRRKP